MAKVRELQQEANGCAPRRFRRRSPLVLIGSCVHRRRPCNGVDDLTVLRFVRGEKGSVKKARKKFAAYVAWRAAERIDEVMGESLPPDGELEALLTEMYKPRILDGLDKLGRPIVYSNMGKVDFGWIFKQVRSHLS
jgi:hypothetical protein